MRPGIGLSGNGVFREAVDKKIAKNTKIAQTSRSMIHRHEMKVQDERLRPQCLV